MPDQHFIGNRWVASASHQAIPVIDPSDGQQYDEIARGNASDIHFAVETARVAFEGQWSLMSAA